MDTGAATVVSIERHDGRSAKAEHTNADSLSFRVTFSEDVANVDTDGLRRQRHRPATRPGWPT